MSLKSIFNIVLYLNILILINSQEYLSKPVSWCAISTPELEKCEVLKANLPFYSSKLSRTHKQLTCVQRNSHDECMVLLDQGRTDIVSLDANEIFLGGRYHSLVPIMKEVYTNNQEMYYSVAVIQKGGSLSHISSLGDLKGSVGCFPSVSSMAGWIIPISTLIEKKFMDITDCNNHIKSATAFFSGGCAVNILTNKYNPLGDNEQILCNACGSDKPGVRCSTQDPYAGYVGALRCLLHEGDVAFVKHTTVELALTKFQTTFDGITVDDFELLCLDGSRASLDQYQTCNWGQIPSNSIATSSAKTQEEREALQMFLKVISQEFSTEAVISPDKKRLVDPFYLYESSPRYGSSFDLLVSDDATRLVEVISTRQNFQVYLPPQVLRHIETVHSCPVEKMILCVTSYPEQAKCLKMKTAIEAQLLKPRLECKYGGSQLGCMVAIQNRDADVALFEAGDIYTAGLNYDLIPIMAEQYNLDSTDYYVVAVSTEDDPDTDVAYLKNRYTCHPGIMHGGGWVVPLAYLLNNDLIRGYGRNSVRAASEYFQKSCAPGAMMPTYSYGLDRLNLCHLCQGSLKNYCARDHTEPFFGYTGAFRCLVEGGGDVAFVKHTTVGENTDGKRKMWWARNQLTNDFQLLCRDGTRKSVSEYEDCNLGKVRSNAVVTRGGYDKNETEIHAYNNLFLYAQQYFGSDTDDIWNFNLFHSDEPYADLIFQDSTQQLVPLDEEEQHYHPYLGREFLNARYAVDIEAGTCTLKSSIGLSFLMIVFGLLF